MFPSCAHCGCARGGNNNERHCEEVEAITRLAFQVINAYLLEFVQQ